MFAKLAAIVRAMLKEWLVVALVTSAAMLAIAHASERFGGLAPCHMCLQQREVYWWAMGIAAVGIALRFTPIGRRFDRLFALALGVTFSVGVFIAVRHAGAEWKWWPVPETCTASRTGGGVSAEDMAELLSGKKIDMPSCGDVAFRFLFLSMAGWNAIISLKLVIYSGLAALGWKPKGG